MKKKLWYWFHEGGRIPRKAKKSILGKQIRMRVLRKMLSETTVVSNAKTIYGQPEFHPHGAFCPSCGERSYKGTGNLASYPEHWERFHCLRCRSVVAYIDNSPFVHALECADEGYNPVF